MRVVASSPEEASEIAYAYLSDETIIDADWCRDEYAAIANAWFRTAPQAARRRILEYIDALPDGHEDRWRKWFAENHGRPPSPDETRELVGCRSNRISFILISTAIFTFGCVRI